MQIPARILLILLLLSPALISKGQVQASFVLSDTICLFEEQTFQNNSVNATDYIWDFCLTALDSVPQAANKFTLSAAASVPTGLTIIYDSAVWYGFVSSRSNNKLLRLDFGDSLDNPPMEVDLGNVGGVLSGPKNLELFNENDKWYGLLINWTNGSLVRLTFDQGLGQPPTASSLGNLSGWSQPRGLDIAQDKGDIIAIVTSEPNDKVTLLNFGNSITNNPTGPDIMDIAIAEPLLDGPRGVRLMEHDGIWFGILASAVNGKILRLNFGTDLFSDPAIEDLGDATSPTEVALALEGVSYHAFVMTSSSGLKRVDFQDDLGNPSPMVTDLGTFGLLDKAFTMDLVLEPPSWRAYSLNFTTKIITEIIFPDSCSSASENTSSLFEPAGVTFSSAGDLAVSLSALDTYGNRSDTSIAYYVRNIQAPLAGFTTDNACVSNQNVFTAANDPTIVSWDWDFGDLNMGSGQVVAHQYLAADNYDVELMVEGMNGCTRATSEVVKIYDPPTADFDFPVGAICTNSPTAFTNTSVGMEADSAQFSWDFNGEGGSSEQDPVYSFLTDGSKNVSLQIEITGCVDQVSKPLTVTAGPAVDFDWNGNCWQSSVDFSSTVSGTGISTYSWDFGDGNFSGSTDPMNTYAAADTFTVQLGVDNVMGCLTNINKDIIVNDQPLVGFSFNNSVVNIPTPFQSQDYSSVQDSIIDWQWKIDGVLSDSIPNPEFTFSDTGTVNITLETLTAQGCDSDTIRTILVAPSTVPSIGFSAPGNTCLNENLLLENTTLNGNAYVWDFCLNALDSIPTVEAVSTIEDATTPTGVTLVYDQFNWYGFLSSRDNNKLFRLDFGTSLDNEPIVVDLGDLGGVLSGPKNLELIHEQGQWFALLINWSSGDLVRLTFDAGLQAPPTAENLTNLGGWNLPRGLDVGVDNGQVVAIVSSENNDLISLVNFGNSIQNNPGPGDLMEIAMGQSLVSQPRGVRLIRDGQGWHGLLASAGAGKIVQMDFGISLYSVPAYKEIASHEDPTSVSLQNEGGQFHSHILNSSGEMLHLSFGTSLAAIPTAEVFGNFGLMDKTFTLDLVKTPPAFTAFSINFSTKQLFRISFPTSCSEDLVSVPFSTDFEPNSTSFSMSGDYGIELVAFDQSGNRADSTRIIAVSSQQAPPLDFVTDNACLSVEGTFTAVSPSVISSYNWDFGDNSSASGQLTTHQFDTLGTFQVRLTVDDGLCTNTVLKAIPIYNEPIPSFTLLTDPTCTNTPIAFSNTTTGESGDSVTWSWDFAGEGVSSQKEPIFTFGSSGNQEISLSASIPGCTNQFDSTISVLAGPQVGFVFDTTCFSALTEFTNTSTGTGIIGYLWDFGNGVGSTLANPSLLYEDPGDYLVSLQVDNDLGCSTTTSDTLTVHAQPQAEFGNDLSCVGVDVQFYDSTTVENANIQSWLWTFGSGQDFSNYQDQNPIHRFGGVGDYEVKLLATSIYGCLDSVAKSLEVLESPVVDFNWVNPCVDDTVHFVDLSTGTGPATPSAWTWDINGQTAMEQNPALIFDQADSLDVLLSVTSQNLCSVDTMKIVVINPLPIPGFLVEDACANIPTQFTDTTVSQEPLVSREWDLAGLASSVEESFGFQFPGSGDYPVTLTVTSESGCNNQIVDTVVINDFPTAGFEVSEAIGGAPFLVEFFNLSAGATTYLWDFATGATSTEEDPVFEFQNLGTYAVQMKATNDDGCTDAFTETIQVVVPRVDVGLEEIRTVIDQDRLQLILTIANTGNMVIKSLDVTIEIPGQLSLVENLEAHIGPGERLNYKVNFEILGSMSGTSHVCFNLTVKDPTEPELDLQDNFDCLNLDEEAVFLDVYPNPVVNQLSIPMVLPISNPVEFQLLSYEGAVLLSQTYQEPKIGLNIFLLEIGAQSQGLYFLRTRYGSNESTQKIVKQ